MNAPLDIPPLGIPLSILTRVMKNKIPNDVVISK